MLHLTPAAEPARRSLGLALLAVTIVLSLVPGGRVGAQVLDDAAAPAALQRNSQTCLVNSPPAAYDLSTEQRAMIYRLYCSVFLRLPDADGFEYWVDLAERRGLDGPAIAAQFIISDEFRQRYGALSDRAFLDLVYRNVLGRAPDASGYAYWDEAMSRPRFGRNDLMLYFSDGDEFRQATRTTAPTPEKRSVAPVGSTSTGSNWLPAGMTARHAADAELATGTYDGSLCSGYGGQVAWRMPPYSMRWCVNMSPSFDQSTIDGVYVHEAMHARVGALFANRTRLSAEEQAEVTRVALLDSAANEGLSDFWAMRLVPGYEGNPRYAGYVFNNEIWDRLLADYPLGGRLP